MSTEVPEPQPLPTVTEVLAFSQVQAGAPELAAGGPGLYRPVRWAHVAADIGIAKSVDGGELVLMTATAWPSDPRKQAVFTDELIAAGISAIALELGRGLNSAPAEMIRSCDTHDVPLIVLHREVRFVQITQRVHQRILAAQTEALQAREEVHKMLTELGLNRSPVDYVVEQLAATLGCPVVLEDSAHRVVAVATRGEDPATALEYWSVAGEPTVPAASARVPVEARGSRWGFLTALPGPPHPAGRRTVLELGAFALALGRLADTSEDPWLQLSSKRVFEALLSGRYRNDTELEAQLAAAGLPIRDRVILTATLRGTGSFGAHESLEHATLETALRRAVAPEGRVLVTEDTDSRTASGPPSNPDFVPGAKVSAESSSAPAANAAHFETGSALLALISFPEGDARLGNALGQRTPELAARIARELEMLVPDTTPAAWRGHLALGVPGKRLRQLVASLEQLRSIGRLSATAEVGRVSVQQAEQQPLAHLVRSLSGAPELQQFAADMLGPILEHDRGSGPGHTGDLVQVLAAYTAHPTNRSLAAQRARLSRSVFYQRIELIEQLLGVDLADGETIAALTVALLARPR